MDIEYLKKWLRMFWGSFDDGFFEIKRVLILRVYINYFNIMYLFVKIKRLNYIPKTDFWNRVKSIAKI